MNKPPELLQTSARSIIMPSRSRDEASLHPEQALNDPRASVITIPEAEASDHVSTLTMDTESVHYLSTQSYINNSQRRSSAHIVPRSSKEWRISEKTNEMSVSKLRFEHLPLFGRDAQIKLLKGAFETVVERSTNSTPASSIASDATTPGTATPGTTTGSDEAKPPLKEQNLERNTDIDSSTDDTTNSTPAATITPGTTTADVPAAGLEEAIKPPLEVNNITRGLVLLQGSSGTGKTSLVQDVEFTKVIRSHRGIFTFGKCELQQVNEPYAVVQDAMGLLCYNILRLPRRDGTNAGGIDDSFTSATSRSSGSGLSLRRASTHYVKPKVMLEDIQEALSVHLDASEWKVLIEAVPGLEKIMMRSSDNSEFAPATIPQSDSDTPDSNNPKSMDGSALKETCDRLKYVYRHFLRTIASVTPLVLVLDDCQWADKASLGWIKDLVSDTQDKNGSLLVVVSYRGNEVDESHELAKMILDLKSLLQEEESSGANASVSTYNFLLQEITVGNLSTDDINGMLSLLLEGSKPEATMELAQVLHQKTLGNAFFVVQFLLRLQRDKHLTFSLGLMSWDWHVEDFKEAYGSTDNVGDLMQSKLKDHAVALQVLPVAACIGRSFSHSMLQTIMDGLFSRDNNLGVVDSKASLHRCVKDGFLELVQGKDYNYQFVHDKIQEAALEFLDLEVKIMVGDIFLGNFLQDKTYLENTIFSAVNLVNLQAERLKKGDDKLRLLRIAEMNAVAGTKSLEVTCFASALKYFNFAMTILPEEPWTTAKDLTLNIHVLAGAAEFCTGNGNRVKEYTNTVMEQKDVTLEEKIDLCHTLMDVYEANIESGANLEFGLRLLKEMKCKFPKSAMGITFNTVASLLKAKMQLKKKLSLEKLQSQPIVTDKRTMMLMKTLDKFASAAFHAKPELLPLVILEMAKFTDKLGLNPYSAVAYPTLGLLFAGVLDDFQTAKVCGDAGLAIMKRSNYPAINARCIMMTYFYALHWSTPLQNCTKPLLEGYETGMRMGTLDGAFWCISFFLEFSFWCGGGLHVLEADFTTYMSQMESYDAKKAYYFLKFTRHMILRLRGTADEAEEKEYYAFCVEKGEALDCILRRSQMLVACIFGEHEKAAEFSLEWHDKIMKQLPAQISTLEVTFLSALSCFAVLRKSPKSKKAKKYSKHATLCTKKIKGWVSKSCPNCVAHESLLEAERLALAGNKGMALRSFESAVLLAGRRGLTHIQALANERHAIYLEESGDNDDADYHWRKAKDLYADWGATAKVEQLEIRCSS